MKLLGLGSIVALLITLGCATTSQDILPPSRDSLPPQFKIENSSDRRSLDYFLLKMADSQPQQKVKWWVDYRRAKLWQESDPQLACEKYFELSQQPLFALNQVALLKAHKFCLGTNSFSRLTPLQKIKIEPWQKKLQIEAEWALAQFTKDLKTEFNLAFEKSKQSLLTEEKLIWNQAALEIAQKLNDPILIEKSLKRKLNLAPRFIENPTPKDLLNIAIDYRKNRDFEKAREFYSRYINESKPSKEDQLSALKGIAQTFKLERKMHEHIEALKKITQEIHVSKKSKIEVKKRHAEVHLNLAKALWTEDHFAESQNLLLNYLKEHPKSPGRGEIFWLLGRMAEETQKIPEAVEWFLKAEESLPSHSDLLEKLYWYLGWNQRKLGHFLKSNEHFQKGVQIASQDFSRSRFKYWIARNHRDLAMPKDALRAIYLDLISSDPIGYYGLLAHHDLEIPIERRIDLVHRKNDLEMGLFMDVPLFEWLISVEDFDLAQQLLDQSWNRIKDKSKQADEFWLEYFEAYARTGSYQLMYDKMSRLSSETRQNLFKMNPHLLFPQPFKEVVKSASEKSSVSEELIYSIMRQESSFNPLARSTADAFGLMQLLPEVAVSSSDIAQVNYKEAQDLYLPEVNIPIGAMHLKHLSEKFQNRFILTVASYNASEKAIYSWLQTRYKGDSLSFIEDIPYEETRGYIRLVMRNLIFYQMLNTSSGKIEFPKQLLDLN